MKLIEVSMKSKVIVLILIGVFSGQQLSFGQYLEREVGLKSRFRPGIMWFFNGGRPYDAKMLRKYDRFIVDVVYNDWFGDRKSFSGPWYSIGVNTQLMFDVVLRESNTVSFGWGIGWSHVNNISSELLERDFVNNATYLTSFPSGDEPSHYKFVANYLEIPLELRFRSAGYNHFKFMMGAKIGVQLNAYDQYREQESGTTIRMREYGFADNSLLRYGAIARMGFRNYAIFGELFFSNLFSNRESAQLLPFSLGVSISLF